MNGVLVGQDSVVGVGKSTTSIKFKSRRGYVREERLVLSIPHSSKPDVVANTEKMTVVIYLTRKMLDWLKYLRNGNSNQKRIR